ncbi:hypothetical protein CEXT_136121 [Caerostris extrusa]|uniref:Ribosomal protein S14 n=1 Tax=Caerostris extrusa TaxID=172846 RepID=A0AAV4MKS6_CAEEX|nr:hypothetical protein CEXT_136121 [Caerostris extrusa]
MIVNNSRLAEKKKKSDIEYDEKLSSRLNLIRHPPKAPKLKKTFPWKEFISFLFQTPRLRFVNIHRSGRGIHSPSNSAFSGQKRVCSYGRLFIRNRYFHLGRVLLSLALAAPLRSGKVLFLLFRFASLRQTKSVDLVIAGIKRDFDYWGLEIAPFARKCGVCSSAANHRPVGIFVK